MSNLLSTNVAVNIYLYQCKQSGLQHYSISYTLVSPFLKAGHKVYKINFVFLCSCRSALLPHSALVILLHYWHTQHLSLIHTHLHAQYHLSYSILGCQFIQICGHSASFQCSIGQRRWSIRIVHRETISKPHWSVWGEC